MNDNKVVIGVGGESLLAMADNMQTLKKQINIARLIKARLKELNWDLSNFADNMSISKQTARKILCADVNLTLKRISQLERVLKINICQIFEKEL